MIEWIKNPDADRSELPAHAIERFGLMPGQPLPDEDLRAVVEHVFQKYDDEGGMGRGMRGMRHRHGRRGG